MLAPQAAQARVFISVGFAPPAIPVYEQPVCPGDGYIWTPGYWQYTDDGYQWVDGAWVVAPYSGALWTPGYWGYGGGGYFWNAGYWGPGVGYYGGINYGFGYFGTGFYGGYWNGGHFFYNREYNHFGAGFRGDRFYSQHYGNFDGRPGGASFARGIGNENRGGNFNNANARGFNNGVTNRNGFGQNGDRLGQLNQSNRVANGNEQRGFYGGNSGADNFVRRENNFQQVATSQNNQVRAGNSFSGSNRFSNAGLAGPASNIHPSQGSKFGGQQRSAPAQSLQGGGGFHGGGGESRGGSGRR